MELLLKTVKSNLICKPVVVESCSLTDAGRMAPTAKNSASMWCSRRMDLRNRIRLRFAVMVLSLA